MNDLETVKFIQTVGPFGWILFAIIWSIRDTHKQKNFKGTAQLLHKIECEFNDSMKEFTTVVKDTVCKFKEEDHRAIQDKGCNFENSCHFKSEDHSRLSDTVMIGKTNEIFLKEVASDQDSLVKAMDRIVDKIEDIARELRQETSLLRSMITKKGHA